VSVSVASGRGMRKSTCRKCDRTVYVVEIDGVTYETDPELIRVVSHEKPNVAVLARRMHGELCMRYQVAKEKAKWLKAQKKKDGS
jgi:hypothetical protein